MGHVMWSGTAGPPWAYRAEAVAEGLVIGTGRPARYVLGTFASPYPGRVLRWLRKQAVRIADGLDPDPASVPWPAALRPGPSAHTGNGDVASVFRDWANDDGPPDEARRRLVTGNPVLLVGADVTGWYALAAWPVAAPARIASPGTEPYSPSPPLTARRAEEANSNRSGDTENTRRIGRGHDPAASCRCRTDHPSDTALGRPAPPRPRRG
ncbi:hypothetical protein ACWF94_03830 [Streptomyces sp. NPDC055078]